MYLVAWYKQSELLRGIYLALSGEGYLCLHNFLFLSQATEQN